MKVKSLYINIVAAAVIVLLLLVLHACVDELFDVKTSNDDPYINFTADIPTSIEISTYALSATNENEVATIDILLFADGDKYVPNPIRIDAITSTGTNGINKNFKARIPAGTYSSIVFIANAREEVTNASLSVDESKASVLGKLNLTNTTKWVASTGTGYKPMPMWGEVKNLTISHNTPSTNVKLSRMMAKVNVTVESAAQSQFQLKSINVYNYNNKGGIAPLAANWDGTKATAVSLPTGTTKLTGPLLYATMTTANKACEGEIYLFEAVAGSTANFATNTCLVVGGRYTGDAADSYYRIDFIQNKTTYLSLLRNHQYNVKINSVAGSGYATLADAKAARSSNMEAEVVVYDEGKITDFAFDSQYVLGVSQTTFSNGTGATNNTLNVRTNHPDGWTATISYDPASHSTDWLSTNAASGAANTTADVTLTSAKNIVFARTAYVTIKAGRLTKTITVNQAAAIPTALPYANCYMMTQSQAAITIPIMDRVNANGAKLSNGDAITAELVWTDHVNKIGPSAVVNTIDVVYGAGHPSYLRVSAGSAWGNAVVAVKKGTEILWSWHIWVTSYNPSALISGQFMTVNLGGENSEGNNSVRKRGNTYQWGRKDPFPGSQAASAVVTEPPIYTASGSATVTKTQHTNAGSNLRLSIQNPLTYYYMNAGINDWLTTAAGNQNADLWGDGGAKTIYDPCPNGFRVPSSASYNGLTHANFPWDATNLGRNNASYGGFYPATGRRYTIDGSYREVTTMGYAWGRNTNAGGYSYWMRFNNSSSVWVHTTETATPRAYGLPVRCIKE